MPEHAGSCQPGEHVVAPEAAVGKSQQAEQRACRHTSGQRHDRGPVDGQAGRCQLLVGHPCVGLRISEEESDPIERGPRAHRRHDGAQGGSHLLVRVRDDHDARALGVHHGQRVRSSAWPPGLRSGQPPNRPRRFLVRRRVPARTGDHHQLRRLAQGSQQRGAVAREPLGEVHDDPPEPVDGGSPEADHLSRRVEQVLLVVPRGSQGPVRFAVQPHHVAGASALSRHGIERFVGEVAQLAVRLDQRGLGGGMFPDRSEDAGIRSQRGP